MQGLLTPRLPWSRNLIIGVILSLLVHLSLLALHFSPPTPPPAPTPQRLEVVLLNVLSRDLPDTPQALAQAASAGGGEHREGMPRSPLPLHDGDTFIMEDAATNAAEALPAIPDSTPSRQLLSRQDDQAESLANTTLVESTTDGVDTPSEVSADIASLALQLSQQYAALSQRLEDAARRSRHHYFAPSTSPWAYAEYVEQWRVAVETVGNQHYPPQLRGRLYGSVQLTVTIRADGTLADIAIDTPSIHPEINEAARAILQRAAPFTPFPDAMRRDADTLSITRTWHFENDALNTQAP